MRLRSSFSIFVVLMGSMLAPRATRADGSEGRRPALQWTRGARAAQCIDPRTLATRVEALTGSVLVAPGSADYAIEGHIEARSRGDGFSLRVSVTDRRGIPRGERVIAQRARSCRELDAAITFLIALTIDPDLSLDGRLPDSGLDGRAPDEVLLAELTAQPPAPVILPVEEPTPAPAPESAEPPRLEPSQPARRDSAPRWQLRTGLLFATGELPRMSFGGAIGLSLRVARRIWLDSQIRGSTPGRGTPVSSSQRLRTFAVGAALTLCSGPTFGAWHVRACLGPEPLLLHARGRGFDQNMSASLWSWGAIGRLQLEVALGRRWAVAAQGWMRLGFDEKRFVQQAIEQPSPVHTVARLGIGAAIGVRVDLDRGKHRAPTLIVSKLDGRDE